ncbi:hypothetical protein AVEN_266458-1 [Araneus ventricosus]|uniref:Uncharacterized protein n=1 Tax=Araneus ventricosus TaxID=182803 RepID=A0A4Y2XAC1_ARAVE|nr:hypothetical protein AVEN_266458-1 [Araneus ventricosus]
MIANYRLYRNDRQTSNDQTRIFGGKCTYIKSCIEHHCVPTPELEKMDATIIEIQIGNHPPLKIISAYSRTGLIDGFPLVDLQKLLDSGSNVIIAADLNATNIAWIRPRSSLYSRKLFRYLQGKNGVVVTIPKPNSDLTLPQNYRLISLLNCMSKVFESVLFKRLNQFLDDNNSMISEQFGFRKQLSINHQLVRVTELVQYGFTKSESTGTLVMEVPMPLKKFGKMAYYSSSCYLVFRLSSSKFSACTSLPVIFRYVLTT